MSLTTAPARIRFACRHLAAPEAGPSLPEQRLTVCPACRHLAEMAAASDDVIAAEEAANLAAREAADALTITATVPATLDDLAPLRASLDAATPGAWEMEQRRRRAAGEAAPAVIVVDALPDDPDAEAVRQIDATGVRRMGIIGRLPASLLLAAAMAPNEPDVYVTPPTPDPEPDIYAQALTALRRNRPTVRMEQMQRAGSPGHRAAAARRKTERRNKAKARRR